MRIALILAGLILVGLGIAAFTGALSFNHDKEVLKVGDLSAKVTEEKSVPQWVGGIAVLAGLVLVGVGATRR